MFRPAINKILLTLFLLISFLTLGNAQVQHPEWSYNLAIYEINVRQYSEAGTFEEFEKHLPRLKEMGAGILWFMPITPIGELNRKGSLGSYYSVKDYMAVNPEFGTMEDFKNLVKKIHEMGMYVILDWVANHTSWDNNLVKEHPEWFSKNENDEFMPPVEDWSDVIDLDYDNEELHNYMVNAMKFWVNETDIDGFRCDVAGMVPIELWTKVRKELSSIKPVFLLAEGEGPEFHENAFDATYSWTFFNLINNTAKGEKKSSDFINYFKEEKEEYNEADFKMRFTSNHDENTWNGTAIERLGNSAGMFAAFTFIVEGIPLVYNGQEAGLNKRLKFFERDPIEWKEHEFNKIYTKLHQLKRENQALFNGEKGGRQEFLEEGNDNVLVVFREKENHKVLALFNFSAEQAKASLSNKLLNGNYTEIFSEKKLDTGKSMEFVLKPWEFRIFTQE